ncbi:MAG: hypothetical protein AAF618_05965, partial [Pseudomonadota bacterium]
MTHRISERDVKTEAQDALRALRTAQSDVAAALDAVPADARGQPGEAAPALAGLLRAQASRIKEMLAAFTPPHNPRSAAGRATEA